MLARLFLAACIVLGGFGDAVAQWRPGFGFARPGFQFLSSSILFDFANNAYPAVSLTRASTGLVQDLAGDWTSVGINTLRRSNKGALFEAASTNVLRNNTMQGAAPGTPGTPPTFWGSTLGQSGLTQSIVATGTANGIEYIRIQVSGTTNASLASILFFESLSSPLVVTTGQTATSSVFMRLVAGGFGPETFDLALRENDAGNVFLRQTLASVKGMGAAWTRISNPVTAGASTAGATTGLRLGAGSGTTINFTFDIGWPGLALGALSSPIRTTGTAATRAADDASITIPAGYTQALYTFDDNTTQTVAVSAGAYSIPTNFGKYVKTLELRP